MTTYKQTANGDDSWHIALLRPFTIKQTRLFLDMLFTHKAPCKLKWKYLRPAVNKLTLKIHQNLNNLIWKKTFPIFI